MSAPMHFSGFGAEVLHLARHVHQKMKHKSGPQSQEFLIFSQKETIDLAFKLIH